MTRDPNDIRHGDTWEVRKGRATVVASNDWPPPVHREGVTVHIDGTPTLWLNSPIATRPQDWHEPARRILFPQRSHTP